MTTNADAQDRDEVCCGTDMDEAFSSARPWSARDEDEDEEDEDEDDDDDEDEDEDDDEDEDEDEDDDEDEDEDEDSEASRIHEHLTRLQAKGRFNGVALYASEGEIRLNEAYGYADVRKKKRLAADFVFNLASVSKQFTAMAIMMLKEQGSLGYDDKVTRFIPTLPYKEITIRQLLQHTSGLPEYFDMMEEPDDEDTLLTSHDVLAAFVEAEPALDFAPGTRHVYCNTGYALLSLVIEAASGTSYASFLQDSIFSPLDMQSSFVYDPEAIKPFNSRRAYGFSEDEESDMGYMDGIVGDGGIYSTTADLVLWDRALREDVLVSARTLREALTPGTLKNGKSFNYGFGWTIEDHLWWHSGSWAGFRNNITRYTDGDLMVILTNDSNEEVDDIDNWIGEMLSE